LAKMAAPPAKKAKVDEAAKEEAKKEEVKELETDAPKSSKPTIADVMFHTEDTTINVMTSSFGGLLKQFNEGGMQHLLAGARASAGVKSGRYMYEVKVIEFFRQQHEQKNTVMLGFSTSEADVLLGEGDDNISFDSDGFLRTGSNRTKVTGRLGRLGSEDVLAVLLNLDQSSANYNTVSLFKDGVRMCQPQGLPESLKGKILYPAVTFRGATPHVNFGPEPMKALPFTCRMVDGADKADVEVTKAQETPKDGRYEVLYPVGLPEEGAFDWLDLFLKKSPQYTELSSRALVAWARKSGFHTQGGRQGCRDYPDMHFGIQALDDGSIKRVLKNVVAVCPRHFVVMELKGNLSKEQRERQLEQFPSYQFKKVACIVVGEPPADFKKHTKEVTLKEKQAKSDATFRAQKAAEKKKKEQEKKAKLAEKVKKELQVKKAAAEKKKAEEKKAKEGGAKEAEKKEGKEETKEEEEAKEEVEEEEPEVDEEPPKVELTAEEKQLKFIKSSVRDMTFKGFGTSFTKFTIPDKAEGFDDFRYEWSKAGKAEEYLKQWILEKKVTTRVEELSPSAWSNSRIKAFQKSLSTWQAKQKTYKEALGKKAADKAQKEAAAKKASEQKKKEEESKKDEGGKKEAAEKEAKPSEAEDKAEAEEEAPAVDLESVDVFGVEDICDVGGGMPLFNEFRFEDWTMASLRCELSFLPHAFKHDVDDTERKGISLEHLPFYYTKYFGKSLVARDFGVETVAELLQYVNDTVYVSDNVMESLLPAALESHDVVAKITEESRRERNVTVAVGDETMKLKIKSERSSVPTGNGKGNAAGKGLSRMMLNQKLAYGGGKGKSKGTNKGDGKDNGKGRWQKGDGSGKGKSKGDGKHNGQDNGKSNGKGVNGTPLGKGKFGKGRFLASARQWGKGKGDSKGKSGSAPLAAAVARATGGPAPPPGPPLPPGAPPPPAPGGKGAFLRRTKGFHGSAGKSMGKQHAEKGGKTGFKGGFKGGFKAQGERKGKGKGSVKGKFGKKGATA